MFRFFSIVSAAAMGVSCCLALSKAHALPIAEVMQKTVNIKLPEATTDDYLLEMARAADVDFMADATGFSTQTAPVGEVADIGPQSLQNVLSQLSKTRDLSHLRYDERTLLFWTQPDWKLLATALNAGQSIAIPTFPADFKSPVNTATAATENATADDKKAAFEWETSEMVADYLKRTHHWDGKPLKKAIDVKFGDLPAELRDKITTLSTAEVLLRQDQHTIWLSDELWNKAWLQIQPISLQVDNRKYTQMLVVRTTVDGKIIFTRGIDAR